MLELLLLGIGDHIDLLLLQLLLLLYAAVEFLLLMNHCNRRILDDVGVKVQ